jgi:putative NIF3 family GTP cyclohydrolase 1 type 2
MQNITSIGNPIGEARLGTISPISVPEFALVCKSVLGSGVVRYLDLGKPTQKLAVCSGSGFRAYTSAKAAGADTFLTGDIKHSAFLEAQHDGIQVLDCGHYATEALVLDPLIERLRGSCPGIQITRSVIEREPFQCQ